MKRLPILLSLLALIVLAASVAYWVLQLFQPPQRPLAAAPEAVAPAPLIEAAATLFGGQPVATATNYTLTGIVADGNDSVAIIVAEGSPPKAVSLGKEVVPGVVVSEVHARYVMLSDGGILKRIELAPEAKPAAPMGGVQPVGSAPPGGEPPVSAGPVQQPVPEAPPAPQVAQPVLQPAVAPNGNPMPASGQESGQQQAAAPAGSPGANSGTNPGTNPGANPGNSAAAPPPQVQMPPPLRSSNSPAQHVTQ